MATTRRKAATKRAGSESAADGPDPAQAQLQQRKLSLETAKLELETRSLARQLTWSGSLIEWLKASAVPVTLLGAILAFYVGFGQLKQAEQNRTSDRFDKTLVRLASKNPIERITGVSGMRLFIADDDASLHGYGLQSLVDAMAYETDGRVENTILEAFGGLRKGQFSAKVLNGALQHAVEHNRSLVRSILEGSASQIELSQKKRIASAQLAADNRKQEIDSAVQDIPSPIPAAMIGRLAIKDYLAFLDENHSPFSKLKDQERIPLGGLTRVINILIALGAKVTDFSEIFCERCDFTPALDLAGAKFDRAFLNGSDFSRVNLEKASFQDADLAAVSFYRATLNSANLSTVRPYGATFGINRQLPFPMLKCAILRGADLTGMALLFIQKEYSTIWPDERSLRFDSPTLTSAQIDSTTQMTRFSVVVSTAVTDEYLARYPDSTAAGYFDNRERRARDNLFGGGWNLFPIVRDSGNVGPGGKRYTSTIFTQRTDIAEPLLSNYDVHETTILQTFLDQPTLKAMPLIARILEQTGTKSPAQEKVRARWLINAAPDKCDKDRQPWAPWNYSLTLSTGPALLSSYEGFAAVLGDPLWE